VNEPPRPPPPPPLDPTAAANSLRFLLRSPSLGSAREPDTPLLHLRQRLEQQDGAAWLRGCLAKPPFAPLADAERALVAGPLPLAELEALKGRAKRSFGPEQPRELRLASIAAYFLAIAAALKHHRACITGQPLDEVRALLLDLATAIDEPWSSLLSAATLVEPAG